MSNESAILGLTLLFLEGKSVVGLVVVQMFSEEDFVKGFMHVGRFSSWWDTQNDSLDKMRVAFYFAAFEERCESKYRYREMKNVDESIRDVYYTKEKHWDVSYQIDQWDARA